MEDGGNDMKKYLLTVLLCLFLIAVGGTNTVSAFAENEAGLTINSEPAGATVTVSGKLAGYTPVFTIIPGNAMVNVRVEVPGNTYEVWKGSAYVPSGRNVSMNVTVYKKTEGATDVGFVAVSGTDGAQVFLDNSYYGTIADGSFNIDNVKLGLHYVQVKAEGYNDYAALIEVKPKNAATANVAAVLVPVSSGGADVPTTAGTQSSATVPPAPTKSPVCAALPVIALLGVGAVLRR